MTDTPKRKPKADYYERHKPKMDALNIDESKLPKDLEKYIPILAKTEMQAKYIEETYGTVYDLLKYMYWMRFYLGYNYTQIRDYTTIDGFPKYYNMIGWGINGKTIEEAEEDFQCTIREFVKAKEDFSTDLALFRKPEFRRALLRVDKDLLNRKIRKSTVETYGVDNNYDLFKLLYYYINYIKMNYNEVALLYGVAPASSAALAKNFNIKLSRKESRARSEKHGRGNHDVGFRSTVSNRIDILLSNGISGNVAENALRMALANEIARFLPAFKYNIVVGLPTFTIAYPKEIDIPVVIIDTETEEIYRYAVELSGLYFHNKRNSSQRDLDKIEVMLTTDWKLIMVTQKSAGFNQSKEDFKNFVDKLSKFIADDVINPQDWKFKRLDSK